MPLELLEEFPATDDREQMGRLLRHAFPLGPGSFAELSNTLKEEETTRETARHGHAPSNRTTAPQNSA